MQGYSTVIRKISLLLTAIIAGICIFTATATLKLENTLFDSSLHKSMLSRYNIYTHMGNITERYLNEYIQSLGPMTSENQKQQKQFVSLIKNAVTPEMIKLNIDTLIDGLLKYFKNETRFLPDILINPSQDKKAGEGQADADMDDSADAASIAKIDKINLSVLLMYLNRTDITDKLSVVKLFQFILANLPLPACLLLVLCLIAGILLGRSKADLLALVNTVFVSAGIAFFASGLLLIIYLYGFLPRSAGNLSLTLPVDEYLITDYLRSWLLPTIIFLISAGLLAFAVKPAARALQRLASRTGLCPKLSRPAAEKGAAYVGCGGKNRTAQAICIGLTAMVIILSILKAGAVRSEFLSNDLTTAVDRMKGITAFSTVVYAQDAALYTLEIRMTDRATGLPVPGIQTTVTGKSAVDDKNYRESLTSDMEGKSNINLDIGSFKLSFDSTSFPEDYKTPPPYMFEISTAGTTVITISLEKVEKSEPGIIEIQVLDKDNKPVKDLDLSLETGDDQAEAAGKAYSLTNAEGVAVFRVEEGNYSVVFMENGFPADYLIPEPIEVNPEPEKTIRYSIKLVKKAPDLPSKKPVNN